MGLAWHEILHRPLELAVRQQPAPLPEHKKGLKAGEDHEGPLCDNIHVRS